MRLSRVVAALAMAAWIVSAQAGYDAGAHAYFSGDYQSALRELRPLAERGDVYAQLYMGLMHYRGRGVARDYRAARRWLQGPAERGLTSAQSTLARMHEQGRGSPPDPAAAARWYRRAAENGSSVAQFKLATMYRDGRGVGRDRGAAMTWFRAAARAGSAAAQLALARMLAAEGASKEAERWFARLEARGLERGGTYLIDM